MIDGAILCATVPASILLAPLPLAVELRLAAIAVAVGNAVLVGLVLLGSAPPSQHSVTPETGAPHWPRPRSSGSSSASSPVKQSSIFLHNLVPAS